MFKKYFINLILLGCLGSNFCFAFEREIAITIDDLPFVGSANNDPDRLQREQDRLMSIMQPLIDNNIPVTGFVIAGTIEKGQWQLLEQLQQAGIIIGNHTYTHANLNSTAAEKYIVNVEKADKILAPLMSSPKYFRYPYLAEGRGGKRNRVQHYLAENDYIIAPVTIDSKDFLFNARLYKMSSQQRMQNLNQIKQKYLAYIWDQTKKAEYSAKHYKDHPSKQILLIHANLLNSYFMQDIIDLYKKNGYRFISLPEALGASVITVKTEPPKAKESFDELSSMEKQEIHKWMFEQLEP